MKKLPHVPECMKPDDPEAARCCAAPLVLLAGILALALLLAAGCGTVKGIGQDLQDASDVTREYMARED